MSAREEILARVEAALGPGGTRTAPAAIPRDYRASTDDGLAMFLDRLAHYDATTHEIPDAELEQTVRSVLGERRIVVPAGIPEGWTENVSKLADGDPPLTPEELDASDGVLTTCAVAVAQTGTIVLDGGPGMGRRALTLLPDYHLCVVKAAQIKSSLPAAIGHLDPTRPLTFISGPSATVDIEMVRVKGVHGPRRLEVIVVQEPAAET